MAQIEESGKKVEITFESDMEEDDEEPEDENKDTDDVIEFKELMKKYSEMEL